MWMVLIVYIILQPGKTPIHEWLSSAGVALEKCPGGPLLSLILWCKIWTTSLVGFQYLYFWYSLSILYSEMILWCRLFSVLHLDNSRPKRPYFCLFIWLLGMCHAWNAQIANFHCSNVINHCTRLTANTPWLLTRIWDTFHTIEKGYLIGCTVSYLGQNLNLTLISQTTALLHNPYIG